MLRLKKRIHKALAFQREYYEVSNRVWSQIHTYAGQAKVAEYARCRKRSRVDDHTILYESFWGKGIIDNPYAIFSYLLASPEYAEYEHIWAVNDFEANASVIAKYAVYDNVSFVQVGTAEYFVALSSAKYLFNNCTFPGYFVKKPTQVYVNTWHGTPLKAMAYEMPNGNFETANTERNFLMSDYLLAANAVMSDMYLYSYKLRDILPGGVVEEGYPRNDLLVHTSREDVKGKLRYFGIELDDTKKTILYAPTWRGGTPSKTVVDPAGLLVVKQKLEETLGTQGYQVLIKPHHLVYEALKDNDEYKGFMVPTMLDTNEVLTITDVLISDYSSIFFDFLILDRPILFYIPDADRYASNRGIKVPLDELPGPYTADLSELAMFVRDLDAVKVRYAQNYETLKRRIVARDDGRVSERISRLVFQGDTSELTIHCGVHEKKRLLLSLGAVLNTGITHSFVSILNLIDYDEWDVTAYVSAPGNKEEMLRIINEEINPNVRVLVRADGITNTPRERIRRELVQAHGLNEDHWKKIYPYKVAKLEFKRAFGDASFDYIVDFMGYGSFLPIVLLQGEAKKKSIWLHNDIHADMNKVVNGVKKNYETLQFAVSLYPHFDRLVSCSGSVETVNRKNFGTDETNGKFTHAKNTINTLRFDYCMRDAEVFCIDGKEYMISTPFEGERSCLDVTYIELPDTTYTNFVAVGRFSTEKNHERLIRAFARYVKEYPRSRLYLIGSGPLEDQIKALINKLKLQDRVVLTGWLTNPYAIMRRCDCFVFPSLHEGQGIVMFEARMCGLPIIVSDIPAVQDSLLPNGQLVIKPTIQGILEGLQAFSRGEVPVCDFNVDVYNREAYQEFVDAIQ